MNGRNPVAAQSRQGAVMWPQLRHMFVVMLAVAISVALIGCKGRTPAVTDPPAPADTSDTSAASAAAPTDSPSPTPAGTAIVTLKGKGDKTSDPFQATGDSVSVQYSFTCAAPSAFTLNFYGTNGSPELPDVLIDDFAAQGADTITESLNGASGPFHFDVVSQCDWSVTVLGTP